MTGSFKISKIGNVGTGVLVSIPDLVTILALQHTPQSNSKPAKPIDSVYAFIALQVTQTVHL
jgi:hypothetical protein